MFQPITPGILQLATAAMADLHAVAKSAPLEIATFNAPQLREALRAKQVMLSPQAERDSELLEQDRNVSHITAIWDKESNALLGLIRQAPGGCLSDVYCYKDAPSFHIKSDRVELRRALQKTVAVPFLNQANPATHMVTFMHETGIIPSIDLTDCRDAQLFIITLSERGAAQVTYSKNTENTILRVQSGQPVSVRMPARLAMSAECDPGHDRNAMLYMDKGNKLELPGRESERKQTAPPLEGRVDIIAMQHDVIARPVQIYNKSEGGVDLAAAKKLREYAEKAILDALHRSTLRCLP